MRVCVWLFGWIIDTTQENVKNAIWTNEWGQYRPLVDHWGQAWNLSIPDYSTCVLLNSDPIGSMGCGEVKEVGIYWVDLGKYDPL